MGTRLFVGNLPYSADEDQIRALFEQDGRSVVDVQLITDRATGRPRGFGFVDMSSQEEADAAIRALNGQEFGGRSLTVNEARERSERPRGGGGRGDRGGFGGGYGNRF
jgi:RNA recognition motif-containing protein